MIDYKQGLLNTLGFNSEKGNKMKNIQGKPSSNKK